MWYNRTSKEEGTKIRIERRISLPEVEEEEEERQFLRWVPEGNDGFEESKFLPTSMDKFYSNYTVCTLYQQLIRKVVYENRCVSL